MDHLVACPVCARHVRATEAACPFCRASLPTSEPAPGIATPARLGRAAIFAFGAALTVSASGCSMALYGGPPIDAGPDAGPVAPAYGGPAIDAGSDAGPIAPAYGGPPIDGG